MCRPAQEATSIRYVAKGVTVMDGEHRHELAGSCISAPHAALQCDPSIFPSPREFVPGGFLEDDDFEIFSTIS